MDPTAGLDGCGESRPPPGLDPCTIQSVASRYANYTTSAHKETEVPLQSQHLSVCVLHKPFPFLPSMATGRPPLNGTDEAGRHR